MPSLFEMPSDGDGPCVEAAGGEFATRFDDPCGYLRVVLLESWIVGVWIVGRLLRFLPHGTVREVGEGAGVRCRISRQPP